MQPHVHLGSIYDIKIWKQLKCPLWDEWIKVVFYWYIYIYYHKKDEIMPFVTTWMDLEGIISCEINGEKQNETRTLFTQ